MPNIFTITDLLFLTLRKSGIKITSMGTKKDHPTPKRSPIHIIQLFISNCSISFAFKLSIPGVQLSLHCRRGTMRKAHSSPIIIFYSAIFIFFLQGVIEDALASLPFPPGGARGGVLAARVLSITRGYEYLQWSQHRGRKAFTPKHPLKKAFEGIRVTESYKLRRKQP